jgi:MerR family mercuric resistance operon transcriptional regulator
VRELAEERLKALDKQIAELEKAWAALRRLAHECGSVGPEPCPILTAFDAA